LNLPPNVYFHSYLAKAGVRFDLNVVDTICKKGFGLSFYLFMILFVLLCFAYSTDNLDFFHDIRHFYILYALTFIYLLTYVIRVAWFRRLRRKLRQDQNPIAVEAYSIVLLDLTGSKLEKSIRPKKSAVLYKECGSKKPRFFTGPVKNGIYKTTLKEQKALVFIDRHNSKYYSVDDEKFFKTVSEKLQAKNSPYVIGKLSTKLNQVNQKVK